MNKKLIKKLIIWAIFIALVVTAIILLVTVVNKKETTPIFQTDGTTLVKYNGKDEEVVISKDIEIIGKSAFQSNDKLKKLTFESGSKIKAISRRAFEDCSKLEEIELPNTITSIGSSAFDGCTSLTNVYYNGTIEDWCKISFASYDSNPMYYASNFYMLDENHEYKEITEIIIIGGRIVPRIAVNDPTTPAMR